MRLFRKLKMIFMQHYLNFNMYQKLGILLSTTGSHPFSKYADWEISPTARYLDLIDRNQWLTRRMSVYGLHVHLGMSSGEECIRFNNFYVFSSPFVSSFFKFPILARNRYGTCFMSSDYVRSPSYSWPTLPCSLMARF